MPEKSLRTNRVLKKGGTELHCASDSPAWKAGFVLLLVVAGWIYATRAIEVFTETPVPSGDALEYFRLAGSFYQGSPPGENIFLSRYPALPMLLCMIWQLTGITTLVQYLLGGTALLTAVGLIGILAWKRSGPALALISLALLLFQPVMIENSALGLTEPLYVLLIVLMLISGRLLAERPYLYLLPAAIVSSLTVLCRQEGGYFAAFVLIVFSVHYLRTRRFSAHLFIALLICTLSALLVLNAYWNYLDRHQLVPMSYRLGSWAFYLDFLSGKAAFNDSNRIYTLMTFFDWLKLHPLSECFRIFLISLWNTGKTFDSMLFPGASLLTAAGLVRSFFGKWRLEAIISLSLLAFYIPAFYFSFSARHLLPFLCLGVPAAMDGLARLAGEIPAVRSSVRRRFFSALLPAAFCMAALFRGYLSESEISAQSEKLRYPDQSEAELRITTHLYNGRFAEAGDSVAAGLSRNREYAFFHLARGFLLYMQADKGAAFDELETSISLNPYQTEAYYVAYHLHWREGRREQALGCLERSLEYRPEFPLSRKILESLYRSSGRSAKPELWERKGPFNYYLQHPKLRRMALVSVMWWNQLLQKHAPLSGAGPADTTEAR